MLDCRRWHCLQQQVVHCPSLHAVWRWDIEGFAKALRRPPISAARCGHMAFVDQRVTWDCCGPVSAAPCGHMSFVNYKFEHMAARRFAGTLSSQIARARIPSRAAGFARLLAEVGTIRHEVGPASGRSGPASAREGQFQARLCSVTVPDG